MFNFYNRKQLTCKCGCGTDNVSGELIVKLNQLCCKLNRMVEVSSACRCEKLNDEVGGVVDSEHISNTDIACTAVDVVVDGSRSRFEIINTALNVGFNRIGVGQFFIHLGLGNENKTSDVIWLYK